MSSGSCPTRKCDDKMYYKDSFASAYFGDWRLSWRVTVANHSLPRQFEEVPRTSHFKPKRPRVGWKDGSVRIWSIPRVSLATFQLHRCQINAQNNPVEGQKPALNPDQGYNTISHSQDESHQMFFLRLWKTCHGKAKCKIEKMWGFDRSIIALQSFLSIEMTEWQYIWQHQHSEQ